MKRNLGAGDIADAVARRRVILGRQLGKQNISSIAEYGFSACFNGKEFVWGTPKNVFIPTTRPLHQILSDEKIGGTI